MILKTIEFIPSDITTTVESLQRDISNGKYNDILANFCFLTLTEKGLTLVKQDKTIVTNATVDLSNYAKKTDMPNVSKFITNEVLNDYTKTIDLPKFTFAEDGTLSVTINDVTHQYAPINT